MSVVIKRKRIVRKPIRVYATNDSRIGKVASQLFADKDREIRLERQRAKLSLFNDELRLLIISCRTDIKQLYIV